MARPKSYAWTVFLDGRIQQVALEADVSAWSGWNYRITVNGSTTIETKPGWGGAKFKIGKHRGVVKLAGNAWSGFTFSLLIDDRDSSEYDPQRQYAPPQPQYVPAPVYYPPPQAYVPPPPVQQTYVRDREVVYERQVVVVRCKFCSTLTPVDLAACTRCGAQKFS